jgi:hypothetical protein
MSSGASSEISRNHSLGGYSGEFADDDGSPSQGVRDALTAAEDDSVEAYLAAVSELCLSRLLVPLMAAGDETMHADAERHAEMSTVLLQQADGRRALLVFTGVDALTAWNRRARPVPATLDVVAATAVQSEAGTVLIDIAGPHPLVIEGEILANLANGYRLVKLPPSNYGWLAPATTHNDVAGHPSQLPTAARVTGPTHDRKEHH